MTTKGTVPKRSERVRLIKAKLALQITRYKKEKRPYKHLLKGSKARKRIMLMAGMSSEDIVAVAEKYYGKFPSVKKMIILWNDGNRHTWHEKRGRKVTPHRSGFYPQSPFIANVLRNMLMNHERGIMQLKTTETPSRKSSKTVSEATE